MTREGALYFLHEGSYGYERLDALSSEDVVTCLALKGDAVYVGRRNGCLWTACLAISGGTVQLARCQDLPFEDVEEIELEYISGRMLVVTSSAVSVLQKVSGLDNIDHVGYNAPPLPIQGAPFLTDSSKAVTFSLSRDQPHVEAVASALVDGHHIEEVDGAGVHHF